MPFKEFTTMSLRLEFVLLASAENANIRLLCRRFSISPTTGYKWLRRYRTSGSDGLQDLSRRPEHSPGRTRSNLERAVCLLRQQHPAWGGRKLRARLLALGHKHVPSPSTITAILRRNQLIDPIASERHKPFIRFQHPKPNDLWQMDFKGDFPLRQGRCYPLTVIDDHSRFVLGLIACDNLRASTTQSALERIFRRYGLPYRMTMDNGAPWAVVRGQHCRWTQLTVWLLRLGIRVSHSRPHHPQTQGKDERFHRTLNLELLRGRAWRTISECQTEFDRWLEVYNCQRPHEALEMGVPASCYQPSTRAFPQELPAIEYAADYLVRKVEKRGQISYKCRDYFIGTAFEGLRVGLRTTGKEKEYEVYFLHQKIGRLDLRKGSMDH
jgi:transposase InsO family protein